MPSIFPASALSPFACSKTRRMVILSISARAVVDMAVVSRDVTIPDSGCSVRIAGGRSATSMVFPSPSVTARATQFSSSRTFPGQS